MDFKINSLAGTGLLIFLSFFNAQGDVLSTDKNIRLFNVYTRQTALVIKPLPSKTDLIYQAKAYFKAHKQRQFAYHIGLYDFQVSIEGEDTKIQNLSICESFKNVSELFEEPGLAVYDKHGVFQYIEVSKTTLEEVKELLYFISNNVQLNRLALRQHFKPFYAVNTTERTDVGLMNVTYNVEAKNLPHGTKSYWIIKDYLPISNSTDFEDEQVALDQDEICNTDAALKMKGFQSLALEVTENNSSSSKTQLIHLYKYLFYSYVPLKESNQEIIVTGERNQTLIPVDSHALDQIREFTDHNPQIIVTINKNKWAPNEAIISGESGGNAPDLAKAYIDLACSYQNVIMTSFYEQAIFCADELNSN